MTLESISRTAGSEAEAPLAFSRFHPSIALAPYVETLIVGRRVAVLGDATLGLADALVARGARLVHAYDPDPARVAEAIARQAPAFGSPAAGRPAARGVVHAVLGDDLGVRDGAFDAVLIPDLCLFADRTEVVRRAKKLCAHTGAVVVSSPNPDAKRRLIAAEKISSTAPSYYEIFDLLTLQFQVVRMVGQAPFVGYAIVDFAPDREPDVSFDASLMSGTEEPESFVAIASDRPIATDAYLVVEVPAADVLGRGEASSALFAAPPSSRHDRRPEERSALHEAQARLSLMQADLDDLRATKSDLVRQIETSRVAAGEAEARTRDAAKSAEGQAEKWRELEARAGDEHVRAERLTHRVRDLDEELARQRDRAQRLTKQLDDEKRIRQKAEIELGMARGLPRSEADAEAAARIEELTVALQQANGRADGLAAELQQAKARADGLANELQQAKARADSFGRELQHASMRADSFASELQQAKGRADGLASELLAKSKETAELRRENEAATTKILDLGRLLQQAHGKIEEMEEQAQTLRRPQPAREQVVVTSEVHTGMMTRITRLEANAHEERRATEEAKRLAETLAAERDAAVRREAALQIAVEQERGERKDLVLAKATLEVEVVRLKSRLDEVLTAQEAEHAPEVSQLEAALLDRGHRIASLERDLRESERIGRELVSEMEALSELGRGNVPGSGAVVQSRPGASAAPAAPARTSPAGVDVVSADAFQHRIDALAADAAQKQAELLTSTWKIQALEREISNARAASADPSVTQRELSTALVRAQSEIADLRRALSVGGRDPGGVPRAVVEDAVLLHQQLAR